MVLLSWVFYSKKPEKVKTMREIQITERDHGKTPMIDLLTYIYCMQSGQEPGKYRDSVMWAEEPNIHYCNVMRTGKFRFLLDWEETFGVGTIIDEIVLGTGHQRASGDIATVTVRRYAEEKSYLEYPGMEDQKSCAVRKFYFDRYNPIWICVPVTYSSKHGIHGNTPDGTRITWSRQSEWIWVPGVEISWKELSMGEYSPANRERIQTRINQAETEIAHAAPDSLLEHLAELTAGLLVADVVAEKDEILKQFKTEFYEFF
jgi:hypothetical protein